MTTGRQLNARERAVLRKPESPLLFICREPRCSMVFEKFHHICPHCNRLVLKNEQEFRP